MMRMIICGLAVVTLGACGVHHTGGDDDDANGTLAIDPPTSELLILDGVAAHETFTATLTAPDGTTRDVTSETAFTIDSTFGSFAQNDLAMGTAGKTQVFGSYTGVVGNAQVLARLKDVRVDPSLPANTPDLFTGPEDPGLAPTIVYPPPDVVMPRNLGDFDTHWTDAHGNDIFEVSIHTELADVRVYLPGGNGMPAAGPTASWMAFQTAEWTAAVGYDNALQIQVRGVQSGNPGPVGASPLQLVKLSNETMQGGLYYWAAASTTGNEGIYRHDMSMPGQPAQEYLTVAQTGRCVACHVLSRDGKHMAVTYDGGGGAATLVDVGTTTSQPVANNWNFGTFTPDGSQFLAVEGGGVVVRNYADQSVLATMPTSSWVTHLDMSPDGATLVYVHPTVNNCDWAFGNGGIYTRSYDQTTFTFGPEKALVVDGSNNYYPSWSPDGDWILFNRSSDNSGAGAYNNPSASLWVVKSDGSAPPVELATANQTLGLTNSWGRWAPFQQTLGDTAEPMFWITVSSRRDFGTRLFGLSRPQIWMTPFLLDRVAAGQDPSAPLFRLPFQNLESNNHIAQWTEKIVVTQ